jgi:hypothetical protein
MPRSRNEAQLRRLVDTSCQTPEEEWDWKALTCDLWQARCRALRRENHRLLAENAELVNALVGRPADVRRVVAAYLRGCRHAFDAWLWERPVVVGVAVACALAILLGIGGALTGGGR